MSPVTIDFKLLPANEDNITNQWVIDHLVKLVVLPRFSNYQHLVGKKQLHTQHDDVKKLVADVKQLHKDIRDTLSTRWSKHLAAENRKKEHNYAQPNTERLYTDADNITKACLKTRQGEGLVDYIQRVVPFLLVPTKNQSNRLVWVEPAIDEICSRYGFQLGDSGRMRNNFIDGIAQRLFSDIYAQKLNRALKKYFNAKFYYAQIPEGGKKVRVGSETFHYTILKDAKEELAENNTILTDAKNDLVRSVKVLYRAGHSEEAIVGLVKSECKTQVCR